MIEYSFFDNQEVGAKDLNLLTNLFMGAGVADTFEDGVPYNVSKLNDVVSANLSSGVVGEGVSSLLVTAAEGSGQVANGRAIFSDGTTACVTEAESFTYNTEAVQYIYIVSDKVQNKCYIEVADEEQSDGEIKLFVPLAKIENGTVENLRRYAKGKQASMYASDAGLDGHKTLTGEDFNGVTKIGSMSNGFIFVQVHYDENSFCFFTVDVKNQKVYFGYNSKVLKGGYADMTGFGGGVFMYFYANISAGGTITLSGDDVIWTGSCPLGATVIIDAC